MQSFASSLLPELVVLPAPSPGILFACHLASNVARCAFMEVKHPSIRIWEFVASRFLSCGPGLRCLRGAPACCEPQKLRSFFVDDGVYLNKHVSSVGPATRLCSRLNQT